MIRHDFESLLGSSLRWSSSSSSMRFDVPKIHDENSRKTNKMRTFVCRFVFSEIIFKETLSFICSEFIRLRLERPLRFRDFFVRFRRQSTMFFSTENLKIIWQKKYSSNSWIKMKLIKYWWEISKVLHEKHLKIQSHQCLDEEKRKISRRRSSFLF